ncbi:MAG: hypothetical protein ACTHJL_09695, partial [Amnibacterium sp.]
MDTPTRNANTSSPIDERPRGRHRADPEAHPSGPIPVARDLRPPHPSGPIALVGAPPLAELPKDLSDEQLREFLAAARALRRTGPIPVVPQQAPADPEAEHAIRQFTRPIDLPVPAPVRTAPAQPARAERAASPAPAAPADAVRAALPEPAARPERARLPEPSALPEPSF